MKGEVKITQQHVLTALDSEVRRTLPGNIIESAALTRTVLMALIYIVENTPEKTE